jgi:fructokinase
MTAPLIAGIELGGTKCICLLATGPDDIREEVRIPTTTPEETLGHIETVLDRWSGYQALGIASFGPVSIDRDAADYGSITATTKAGWSNTDVARRFAARAGGVPTGFDSDVAGAALSEGIWGAAQGLADHAYITVGTGVGVGLVMHGRPTSGMTHPELGHIRPTQLPGDTWPGICTYHGACVEGLASGPAIQARTGTRAPDLPLDHPVWDTVAHTLAQLLHILVLTGIPRRIVMGGGVITGMPHLLPLIRERLVASLGGYGATGLIEPVEQFVVPAALGNSAGPLGAIVLGQRALGY